MGAMAAALGDTAFATTTTIDDPLLNVSQAICKIAAWLKGPIGVGIILAMIIIAGISFVTGGKRSSSILISALIGAVIVFGARAVAGLVTTSGGTTGKLDTNCSTGGNFANP
jgi:type IV secretory pathway VirB2 component (pilin)